MSFLFTLRGLRLSAAVGLAAAIVAGCTYSHGDPAPCGDAAMATYQNVVSPIFDAHCRECHSTAQANILGGGNNFGDYQHIKNYGGGGAYLLSCIKHEPGADPMPQARDKLSDCDIARIEAWIQAGEPNN